jgi:hypothetical protein
MVGERINTPGERAALFLISKIKDRVGAALVRRISPSQSDRKND